MEKELYEKPRFEEVSLLCCNVITDSDTEETTPECEDIFDESCEYSNEVTNMLNNALALGSPDGFVEGEEGTEGEESEDNLDDESTTEPLEETDLSGLSELADEINGAISDGPIDDGYSDESSGGDSGMPIEDDYSSEEPVDDTPIETVDPPVEDAGFDGE